MRIKKKRKKKKKLKIIIIMHFKIFLIVLKGIKENQEIEIIIMKKKMV